MSTLEYLQFQFREIATRHSLSLEVYLSLHSLDLDYLVQLDLCYIFQMLQIGLLEVILLQQRGQFFFNGFKFPMLGDGLLDQNL